MIIILARLGLRARRKWSPSNSAISTGRAGRTCRAWQRSEPRSRADPAPMSAKHWPTTSGRIVSRHRAPLFVSVRAPHGPFKDGTVLNNHTEGRVHPKPEVRPPLPICGIPMSCAIAWRPIWSAKVRRSPEVSDMLRHRSRASTLIYAKLDIEGLRSIAQALALPWRVHK